MLQCRLEPLLYHRRGLVRKGAALVLRAPRVWSRCQAKPADYLERPPVLSNSVPKSGTHLLDQIVAGLPLRVNYGSFLSSMTSSFQMRQRSNASVLRYIASAAPGENVRAHVFYQPAYAEALRQKNYVHYFIYRDPRDVVASGAHYLREINPWHRLRKYFKDCRTIEEAILQQIRGLQHIDPRIPLPSVAERFALYEGWITCPETCALRFEDLRGPQLDEHLRRIVDAFADRSSVPFDREAAIERLRAGIAPKKSHTFRKGQGGGWRDEFTPACKEAFKEVAGPLLIRLGYETDDNW
jgi:hypothetical protein